MSKKNIRLHGKIIGRIEEGVYYSDREFSKHFFFKFNGWGLSEKLVCYLISKSVKKVVLLVDWSHKLTANLDDFIYHSKLYTDTSSGFEDPQLILSLEYFNKKQRQEVQLKI